MTVKDSEGAAFADFLENLGYAHHDETKNAAYKQFLE